uniref:Uncharacterized protein n=1 Tax=Cucumis melo TaxID=3656 RepID=A0A9I9CYP3_CUCME
MEKTGFVAASFVNGQRIEPNLSVSTRMWSGADRWIVDLNGDSPFSLNGWRIVDLNGATNFGSFGSEQRWLSME